MDPRNLAFSGVTKNLAEKPDWLPQAIRGDKITWFCHYEGVVRRRSCDSGFFERVWSDMHDRILAARDHPLVATDRSEEVTLSLLETFYA